MPDPAAQLARIDAAGFDIQTLDRFPRSVAVLRNHAIALLESTPAGLRMLGSPGWRMADGQNPAIGVLVEANGRQVFRAKQSVVEATEERLAELRAFREELESLLESAGA